MYVCLYLGYFSLPIYVGVCVRERGVLTGVWYYECGHMLPEKPGVSFQTLMYIDLRDLYAFIYTAMFCIGRKKNIGQFCFAFYFR